VNQLALTPDQRALYERVLHDAVESGQPVGNLLRLEEAPAEDVAAVADAFTPGAGKDYLD
jgi:hypothetical protein